MGWGYRAMSVTQMLAMLTVLMLVFLVMLVFVLVDFFGVVINHRWAVVMMLCGRTVVVMAAASSDYYAGHAYPDMHIHVSLCGCGE